jgi:two-component system, response regulator YesN
MMLLQTVVRGPDSQRWTILVVDDESDIREAVKDVLESALDGTTVHTADSGTAALSFLQGSKVDLIVTDYKMPGMNGVQFLSAAEKVTPGIHHILVTAFDRDLVHDLGSRAAGERILQKPLDPERLIREVERALPK